MRSGSQPEPKPARAAAGEPGAGPAGQAARPAGEPVGALNVGPAGARSRLNTGGMIYGTIVSASALVVGSGHGDTPGDIVNAMTATVIIYWLAHVYTATLSGRRAGSATPLRRRVRAAARHETPILAGGLPTLAVVVGLWAAGVSIPVMVLSALATAAGVLAVEGFLAGRQAGVRGWRLPVEGLSAAVFGLLIALLLVALHT